MSWAADPDAVALGDCVAARAAVQPTDGPADRLAAARCALDLGDAEAALRELGGVTGLDAWARWLRTLAWVRLERWDDLLAVTVADLPVGVHEDAEVARGRAQAARAMPTPWLDAHLDRADARFWSAVAAAARGQHDLARARWLDGWADARRGGWDQRAADALRERDVDVEALDADDLRGAARRRVAALGTAERHVEAWALLRRLEPAPAGAAALRHARAAAAARDWASAVALWNQADGPAANASGTADHLFERALTHARADDYDTAALVYRRLMAAWPGTEQADFAAFKLGYMKWDRRECAAAIPLLQAVQGAHRDEAQWFLARCQTQVGAAADAVRTLVRLQQEAPRSTLAPGAAYWVARAQPEPWMRDAELQTVRKRWPTAAWSWFIPGPPPAPREAPAPPAVPEAWRNDAVVSRVIALRNAGLLDWARLELATARLPDDDRFGRASLRSLLGDHAAARSLAKPFCAEARARALCSPLPERALVERIARAQGLDPVLAWGVMEAESSLDPTVTSPVGARGLMQLMPEVGARLHRDLLPSAPYDPDRLYQARYNAFLGTSELARLHARYRDRLGGVTAPAVVAAYNAGQEAVDRWLAASDGDPAAFADDIPWTETRRYVRRVLSVALDVRRSWGVAPPSP